MSDYLLMVLEDEDAHAALPAHALADLIERRSAFERDSREGGHLRDSGHLRPSKEAARAPRERWARRAPRAVRGRREDPSGPITGLIAAPSADAAAKLAEACPALASDEIDVRPVMKGTRPNGDLDKPGKIFACVVLGRATSEDAWVEVMNRIDAASRERSPEASFLGGVRLEPPRSGRRVATRGERRAVVDGPFLESKEVIGGIFLLRMAQMDDAVRWAGTQGFVAHGTLEIRERWRT
ncbi:MAG: YciI family protein [Polyangiaceae bacterium]